MCLIKFGTYHFKDLCASLELSFFNHLINFFHGFSLGVIYLLISSNATTLKVKIIPSNHGISQYLYRKQHAFFKVVST